MKKWHIATEGSEGTALQLTQVVKITSEYIEDGDWFRIFFHTKQGEKICMKEYSVVFEDMDYQLSSIFPGKDGIIKYAMIDVWTTSLDEKFIEFVEGLK